METTEDILKEFEDFAAREETNPNFKLSFTKDQFGKETLRIDLLGEGGQFKSPLQKIKGLFIYFAALSPISIFLIILFYQSRTNDPGLALFGFFILIFIHALGLDLVNLTSAKNILSYSYAPNNDGVNDMNDIALNYQLGFLPIFYYRIDF